MPKGMLFWVLLSVAPLVLQPSPTARRPLSASPFRNHVMHVVGRRSEKQVLYIDARRIVAPMQDFDVFRDDTIGQLPRNAVGKQIATFAGSFADYAVAVLVHAANPQNAAAFVRRPYVRTEPF